MDPISLLINIRDAKPAEFGVLGRLHASAFTDNDLCKALWAKVDPEARRKWIWEGAVSDGVARGTDAVRVLERTDTGESIGVIWISIAIKHNQDKKDERPRPDGFNHEDLQKMMGPTRKWQEELLETYGGYLCESLSTLRPKRCELTDWYHRC
jgi:hypothetical protein